MISKPASILYAEDDDEDRLFFLEAVRCINENITIINTVNGEEVIDYLTKATHSHDYPLAIVSDMRMPLCDGLEMLRIVKQTECWKQIPVILFSTSSSNVDRTLAKGLGVDAYFTKPATYRELVEVVKNILDLCKAYGQVM